MSAELIDIILSYLCPRRKIAFSRTCRAYKAAYLAHMYSICKKAIARFDVDPERLMKALLKTGAIITGSVPTAVLTGDEFIANNLDIMVPASSGETMRIFMRHEFGFTLEDTNVHQGARGTMRMEYTFKKEGHTVILRVATGENPLVPLMLSDSTITMNFISPWGIFCPYPQLTLWKRGMMNHFTEDDRDSKTSKTYLRIMKSFHKYNGRGFDQGSNPNAWQTSATHKCYLSAICPHTIRTLYDSSGLFVKFGIQRHLRSYLSDTIRYNDKYTVVWSLGGDFCNQPVLYHRAFSESHKIYPRVSTYAPRGRKKQILKHV